MPSDDAALSAAAIGRWNHALRSLAGLDPALERLRTLMMAGRPFCSVARPNLMTPVRYEARQRDADDRRVDRQHPERRRHRGEHEPRPPRLGQAAHGLSLS